MEKRKTINGEDILVAMSTLGFDNYVEPLKLYLQKYREVCYFIISIKNIYILYCRQQKVIKIFMVENLYMKKFRRNHLVSILNSLSEIKEIILNLL